MLESPRSRQTAMSTLEGIESDRLVETVATAWERE
jgi:hypothetical protein